MQLQDSTESNSRKPTKKKSKSTKTYTIPELHVSTGMNQRMFFLWFTGIMIWRYQSQNFIGNLKFIYFFFLGGILLTLWAFFMLSSPYSEFWKAIRIYLFSRPSIDSSWRVLFERIPYHWRKFPNNWKHNTGKIII